jgi:hypothetical protein
MHNTHIKQQFIIKTKHILIRYGHDQVVPIQTEAATEIYIHIYNFKYSETHLRKTWLRKFPT